MKKFNLKISTLLFLSLLTSSVMAQSYDDAFRSGGRYFKKNNFDEAILKFTEALQYNSRSDKAMYYLAMSYKRNKQFKESAMTFKKLKSVNPDYNPAFYYEAGLVFIELNMLNQAKGYLESFLKKYPDNPKNTMKRHQAKNRLEYVKQSPILRRNPNSTSDEIAMNQINSSANDYAPQVNPVGTRLYFTSVRQGGFDKKDPSRVNYYGEDIYVSNKINGQWHLPELLPEPINSMSDDFGSAFTGDGQTMVYVRCGDKQGVGNCDLYITNLDGLSWTEPKNMGNVVNSTSWDSQPTISSDGTRIIFTSSRKGGYGGSDLYMIEKNHFGDWGIPQNLGSTINTPFNDNNPFIASDGKTLYYSSNGHAGLGDLDVFYSVFENGKWQIPINLGRPINSEGDDKNFTTSAAGKAYFSSSRGSNDVYNIYQIELPDYLKPKPALVLEGVVSNSTNDDVLDALVMVEDMETGELIAVNKSNSKTGEYLVVLPVGRNYSVSASKDGFFFYSQSFELPKDTTYLEITKNISLDPIEKGGKIVLNNIFFESGRAELKPISYVELNKAADLMQANGTMVIEVGGHTDNLGSESQNLNLSQKRAVAVVDYLMLAGIDAGRLQAKGYGESMPIEDNSTANGRKANRRTEFVIVEF